MTLTYNDGLNNTKLKHTMRFFQMPDEQFHIPVLVSKPDASIKVF